MPLPPKSTTAYDPAKAASFNQLRQQGLSESDAAKQAGITKAEQKHYQLNYVGSNDPKSPSYNPNYGKMGPQVMGENEQVYNNALKSGKSEQEAYAVLQQKKAQEEADRKFAKEEQAFLDGKEGKKTNFDDPNEDDDFETGSVATNARTPPDGKVALSSQTTTTETVSGGGSVTRYAERKLDNDASRQAQKEVDAKQEKLDQFYEENPSPYERKLAGLPPLTQEEAAQRSAKLAELTAEKAAAQDRADSLKTTIPGSTVVVPNTTTTETTVSYEKINTNTPVSTPTGADPIVNQNAGTQLTNNFVPAGAVANSAKDVIPGGGQITDPNAPDYNATYAEYVREREAIEPIQAAEPQQVPVQQSLAPGEELVQNDAPPAQQFSPREAAIAEANNVPVDAPAPAQSYYESGGGGGNQGTITRVTTEPVNVPPTVDPAAGATEAAATGGNESTVNIGTDENRGGNLEAATKQRLKEQQAIQAQFQAPADGDWRVRIKLAPSATYLYMDSSNQILSPLKATNGVLFPYMPSIQTSYNASYSDTALTHSNYKGYFYNSSYVGDIAINGVFTAQDTREANYLLAVIHFFRSVTRMFYGQDAQRGAPPPLVYIQGLGEYQFNNQPCVVKSFTYNLPTDVDYIRTKPNNYNINLNNRLVKSQNAPANSIASVVNRLANAFLNKGALPNTGPQSLTVEQSVTNVVNDTYVPTKIEIQLSLLPIQTRSQQSQQFSVKDFGNGKLLRGGFW